MPIGEQIVLKKKSVRAEDQKSSHPDTEQQSSRTTTEVRRDARTKKIRFEPNSADWTPVVQPTEADSNLIFFVYPVLLLERGAVTVGDALERPVTWFCTRHYAFSTMAHRTDGGWRGKWEHGTLFLIKPKKKV